MDFDGEGIGAARCVAPLAASACVGDEEFETETRIGLTGTRLLPLGGLTIC